MTRGLLDTSVFIAVEVGRRVELASLPDEAAVSTVTLGELRAGVLAAADLDTRDRRLETWNFVSQFDAVPIDEHVAAHWARLRLDLRERGRSMPVNDSWIAATAIALSVPVYTQDDDFDDVPGVRAVRL